MVAGVSSARTRRPRRDCRRISRPRTHHHPSSGLPTRPTTSCTSDDHRDTTTASPASSSTPSSSLLHPTSSSQHVDVSPHDLCFIVQTDKTHICTSTACTRDRHTRRHADDEHGMRISYRRCPRPSRSATLGPTIVVSICLSCVRPVQRASSSRPTRPTSHAQSTRVAKYGWRTTPT